MALAPLIRSVLSRTNVAVLASSPSAAWSVQPKRWGCAYPDSAMEPTTDKRELAEMEPSDKRHFSQIKALETQDYICAFQDPLVEKFISMMLNIRGKHRGNFYRKIVTRDLMYKCIEYIKITQLEKYHRAETDEEREAIETNPYAIIHHAVENCKPLLKLMEVQKGAIVYKVPTPVSPSKQQFLALRWIIDSARYDKFTPDQWVYERLALEFLHASENTGKVVRMKQELHKEAENNKAYAHFRWMNRR